MVWFNWKTAGIVALSPLIIVALFNLSLLNYGLQQARGQIEIIMNALPIEEVLDDPKTPEDWRVKIRAIQEAKEYAKKIGLVETKNYSTLYDQHGEVVLWNLSACQPFSFESKEWSFPFLGSFAYKGFFSLDRAKEERELLQQAGYDTRIRPVGAWSTLGWFKDPILSNMLDRSEGDLVETIFHELTHGTIFFKDSLDFNENLATFIGIQAAERFLESRYGIDSPEYFEYINENEDASRFRKHIIHGRQKLDSLYQSIGDLSSGEKQKLKTDLIDEITSSLDTIPFHDKAFHEIFSKAQPNNAYFMAFKRYHEYADELELIFEQNNRDLAKFIAQFSE